MNVVIRCIVYLRIDQAAGTLPQLNHPLDTLLRRLIEYGAGHYRIFAVVNLTVHKRIREIAHIGISRNGSLAVNIHFGYFYPFIFPIDVPHRRMELLREVCAGGDASVEMELNATGNVNFDLGRFGIGFTASPRHADGVVVSGPVTANMAEALEICYDAVAEPKILVACGSEACSGGLFADSRAVDRTFFDTHTPDLWLPVAPTHPMTYIDGMMNLLGRKTRQ